MKRLVRLMRRANAGRMATHLLALGAALVTRLTPQTLWHRRLAEAEQGADKLPRLLWGALFMLLATPPCAALEGVVTRVTDGDTLWVRPLQGGKPRKLRVQGIDAPERCQPWGPEASLQLSALVQGRSVRAVEGPVDDHGRRLVRLLREDVDVGAWMVREGHAWSYRYRRDPGPYAAEEREARAHRRGLFADPAAMPPREFRRTHGPCT